MRGKTGNLDKLQRFHRELAKSRLEIRRSGKSRGRCLVVENFFSGSYFCDCFASVQKNCSR